MSSAFDLDLLQGSGSHMTIACSSCKDYAQDDGSILIGDEQGLPALRPNVAIIIIGLGFTLVIVVAFAVFAKFMRPHMNRQNHRNGSSSSATSRLWDDVVKNGSAVDAKAIKSLPLVVYVAQSFHGLKLDLECAICLSQFDDGEELRLLPSCKHMFHPGCIDDWLRSHPFCPLCRSNVVLSTSSDARGTRPESASADVAQDPQHRGTEDQQQRSQLPPTLDHQPHVEISVLERFEARLEALRGRCYYGRKGKNCSSAAPEPVPREGHVIELEQLCEGGCDSSALLSPLPREGRQLSKLDQCDLVCNSSAFGQGSSTAAESESRNSQNCDGPVGALCISVLPDGHDPGHDRPHAAHGGEQLAASLGCDRILHGGSSSGTAHGS